MRIIKYIKLNRIFIKKVMCAAVVYSKGSHSASATAKVGCDAGFQYHEVSDSMVPSLNTIIKKITIL